MALRKIRWKDVDFENLHKAVNRFNKELKRAGENQDYMPKPVDYNQLKENIVTRKGLQDTIKSLDRLSKENAKNVITTDTGLRISEYEWNEIKRANRIYKQRLRNEYKELSIPREGEKYSRVQMGTERARRVEKNLNENNMKRLMEARDTTQFKEIQQALLNRASEDMRYLKTVTYQKNYMEILETRYSTFHNYDKLKNKIENMTPAQFYEFMKNNELTEDLTYQSDQHYGQAEFNSYLIDLGILDPNEIYVEYDQTIDDIVGNASIRTDLSK